MGDNKMDLKVIWCESVYWIHLAQVWDQRRNFVDKVMNIWFSWRAEGIFFTSWKQIYKVRITRKKVILTLFTLSFSLPFLST